MIRRIKEQRGFKTVIHIGDGATDLEACPPADAFIGKKVVLIFVLLIQNFKKYLKLCILHYRIRRQCSEGIREIQCIVVRHKLQ